MTGFNAHSRSLSADDVAARLASAQPPVVVDVREPEEFAEGHIPGCRLVPLGSLMGRLGELPKDQPLVLVCRSGARSAMATQALNQAGFQAANMEGGMMAWRGPVER